MIGPSDHDTWSKYQKSKIEGTEFKGDRIKISEQIYNLIRPLWLSLSENLLLETCLHGRTQIVNEAFNAFVWKGAPKDTFIGKNILDMSVASAVVSFNDGSSGVLQITKEVGVQGGISAVRYKSTDRVKSRRKKLHAKQKGYTNLNENDYGADMHSNIL